MSNPEHNTINYLEFSVMDSQQISEIKDFYSNAFGWVFQDWGPSYIDTQSSGLGCGFSVSDSDHDLSAPLAVIYANDLDSSYEIVTSAGGIITRETFEFPGGRRFHFKDPVGNELAVWSDK